MEKKNLINRTRSRSSWWLVNSTDNRTKDQVHQSLLEEATTCQHLTHAHLSPLLGSRVQLDKQLRLPSFRMLTGWEGLLHQSPSRPWGHLKGLFHPRKTPPLVEYRRVPELSGNKNLGQLDIRQSSQPRQHKGQRSSKSQRVAIPQTEREYDFLFLLYKI